MDFFERIEKERKNIEREKNKQMKDFVIRKINFIKNIKYILEEIDNKKMYSIFDRDSDYKINLEELVNGVDQIINIHSNVTTNGEISENQRTFSNNNYELNLLLTINV